MSGSNRMPAAARRGGGPGVPDRQGAARRRGCCVRPGSRLRSGTGAKGPTHTPSPDRRDGDRRDPRVETVPAVLRRAWRAPPGLRSRPRRTAQGRQSGPLAPLLPVKRAEAAPVPSRVGAAEARHCALAAERGARRRRASPLRGGSRQALRDAPHHGRPRRARFPPWSRARLERCSPRAHPASGADVTVLGRTTQTGTRGSAAAPATLPGEPTGAPSWPPRSEPCPASRVPRVTGTAVDRPGVVVGPPELE